MTYKLSQLGHDVQSWSVTVVHAVNVSTTRRRIELSCVAINGPLDDVARIDVDRLCGCMTL